MRLMAFTAVYFMVMARPGLKHLLEHRAPIPYEIQSYQLKIGCQSWYCTTEFGFRIQNQDRSITVTMEDVTCYYSGVIEVRYLFTNPIVRIDYLEREAYISTEQYLHEIRVLYKKFFK